MLWFIFYFIWFFFCQIRWFSGANKPIIVSLKFIILSFRFLNYKRLLKQTKEWSPDILWRHKTVFLRFLRGQEFPFSKFSFSFSFRQWRFVTLKFRIIVQGSTPFLRYELLKLKMRFLSWYLRYEKNNFSFYIPLDSSLENGI